MKFRLCFLIFALLLPTAAIQPQEPTNTEPCEPFRVIDIVRRVIYQHPTDHVTFFELRAFDPHFKVRPPSPRFGALLKKGNKVDVRGERCQREYYVQSVSAAQD